ncbi:MAG: AraC family transcriptional regulator [Planctomycetota bacterium]
MIDTDRWLAALVDPAARLTIHNRYIGTSQRDDGWSCERRRVSAHWLILVLDGAVRLRASGRQWSVGAGQWLWLPPGVRHDMRWGSPLRLAEFYLRLRRGRRSLSPIDRVVVGPGADGLRARVDRIADEMQSVSGPQGWAVRGQLLVFFTDLWRQQAGWRGDPRSGLTEGQRSRVLRLTRERILDGIGPSELAAAIGLSANYFSRRFKEAFGLTPRVWLNHRRLEAGQRLLEETSLSVSEIAGRLGYRGTAQFSRQFTRYVGKSPRAYRRGR